MRFLWVANFLYFFHFAFLDCLTIIVYFFFFNLFSFEWYLQTGKGHGMEVPYWKQCDWIACKSDKNMSEQRLSFVTRFKTYVSWQQWQRSKSFQKRTMAYYFKFLWHALCSPLYACTWAWTPFTLGILVTANTGV